MMIDARVRLPDEYREITKEEMLAFYGKYDEVLNVNDLQDMSTENLLKAMSTAGIDKAVVHAEYEFREEASELNKNLCKMTENYLDKFYGFGTVDLNHLQSMSLLEEVSKIAEFGFKGINLQVYIIGLPVVEFTNILTTTLNGLGSSSLLIFGNVIGVFVSSSVDYGGPINKTVFAFVLTIQVEGVNGRITALQLVNTSTPIGFGLAYFIGKMKGKNIYTLIEVETLKSAVPMGVINIVEGVIPIVLNDIFRVIFATAVGQGAAGGAVSMLLGKDATVPFGRFLMLPTMTQPLAGVAAIVVNVIVTGFTFALIKKSVSVTEEDIDLDEIQVF